MTRRRSQPGRRGFSERRFHDWLRAGVRPTPRIPLPVGDDVAAVRWEGRGVALLTTDALVEGTHFLSRSSPREIGRATVDASLSDVASKGGRPVALLLDLLLPPRTPSSWAQAVVGGAREEVRFWGGELVGGDTKPSGTRAVVGTILAEGDADHLVPRSGARPGDVLLTTGTVGRGGAAAAALARGPARRGTLRSLLRVEPRLFEGRVLARYAHAMLDTSDGLAEAARLLSRESGVRVEVERDALPVDPAAGRVPAGPDREAALFFGGDYELLAAVPAGRVGAALRAVRRVGGVACAIGTVREGRGASLVREGGSVPMPRAGWQPFEWALRRAGASQPPG